MKAGPGQIKEIFWGASGAVRIACAAELVPAPGQYLLAYASNQLEVPLAFPVFAAGPATDGFLAAGPLPGTWLPGARIDLRGPLGRGFAIPAAARRIALISFGRDPARLLALLGGAFLQGASVTLVCDGSPEDLPSELEIVPIESIADAAAWADFAAADIERDDLRSSNFRALLTDTSPPGQVLVHTSMPCGGIADCGACAIGDGRGYKLTCKGGPVFDLKELTGGTS